MIQQVIEISSHETSLSLKPRRIVVCAGTGCVANGSEQVLNAFLHQLPQSGFHVLRSFQEAKDGHAEDVFVSQSGCQGFCQMGPLVTILPEGFLFNKVREEDVASIISETLLNGKAVERLLYQDATSRCTCPTQHDIPFYKRQQRFTLKMCGEIDPECLEEYLSRGGYFAAKKVLTQMTDAETCKEILDSGLRGRGGGGFPTGKKWDLTRIQPGPKKYIICNGDEGDPGAFMDRSVMEGNPHSVIEGMMIAAHAFGANEGYIYVRAEYPLAVKRMRKAVIDALKAGILGENVFETGKSFHFEVMEGAGAFVCGEETALIASIEGKRGMPMPKPPFPAQHGLWGKPTVINNVETLAAVPLIIQMGAAAYRKIGTAKSPGTKTFALSGHVLNTGLIEVPLGITLKEIIFDIGGGVTDEKGKTNPENFKAVQIGGPSGGCLTRDHYDLPLDFDSLRSVGAMVGSGGLVVMNQSTCMVGMARYFMQFTQKESCGKCVLCREGTKQMLGLLEDVTEGRANAETLELLEELANVVQKGSLCGLGKTSPNPVLSTLRHFRKEYEQHVFHQYCATGECKELARPEIDPAKCKGCRVCLKSCPVSAITGEFKQPHSINVEICIKCGACKVACKLGAVQGV